MQKTESGFSQLIIIVLILIGLILGVYLVQNRTNLTPKADAETIQIVDDSGNPISSTASSTVKVRLQPPGSAVGASLALSPNTKILNRGCEYSVQVNVDTFNSMTYGTDAILIFENNKLTINSITSGDFYVAYPGNFINQATGKLSISGLASFSEPKVGRGNLGTINFTVNPNAPLGQTKIRFDFDPANKNKTSDSNIVSSENSAELLKVVTDGYYHIGNGSCSNQVLGEGIEVESSVAKADKIKMDKTLVKVSGKLYEMGKPLKLINLGSGSYQIEYCDPDGDGKTNFAEVKADGSFEFTLKRENKFCVKAPGQINGYNSPPIALNSKLPNSSEYQTQLAGYDCIGKDKRKKFCLADANLKITDLATDTMFHFGYTANNPTPTPSPLPSSPVPSPTPSPVVTTPPISTENIEMAEDPNFSVNLVKVGVTTNPLITTYTFLSPGAKTLYARYVSLSGQTENAKPFPIQIQYTP